MRNLSLITYLLLPLFLSSSFQINPLQPEEIYFVCTYKLDYQPDSLNKEKRSELMLLSVAPNSSKFESQHSHFIDSINARPVLNQSSLNALIPYINTEFKYKIYKTYINKNINHYDIIGQTTYDIKQNSMPIPWKISNESRTIANYACRKATASFGGRQWVAWFTTEIPVSDGPYKFTGLPGLITELADMQGHYKFSLIKLAKVAPGTKMSFPEQAVPTTPTEFAKGRSVYYLQRVTEVATKGNSTEVAHQLIENYKRKQSKKNNPIELK